MPAGAGWWPVTRAGTQLGLITRVRDRLQHRGVDHRRIAALVGQIELDLQPERSRLGMKARLRQHAGGDIQARPDLPAIALAVLATEGPGGDLSAHGRSIRLWAGGGKVVRLADQSGYSSLRQARKSS